MGILGHFCSFLTHLDMFLPYLTCTNKKLNKYSFWINFLDLKQIIHSFGLLGIPHYFIFYSKSCWIINFNMLLLICFMIQNTSFYLFWFLLIYRLYRFHLTTNWIRKSTIRPSLVSRSFFWDCAECCWWCTINEFETKAENDMNAFLCKSFLLKYSNIMPDKEIVLTPRNIFTNTCREEIQIKSSFATWMKTQKGWLSKVSRTSLLSLVLHDS